MPDAACVHERVLEHVGPNGERRCADCAALLQRPAPDAALMSESRNRPSAVAGWMLVERWCEQYPDDWRLLFKRDGMTLEVRVPEEVWRAFDA